ncbi:hypothetical protein EV207_108131 [Scopulibacillus darangshiensis]|uniref:Transcriptional coactivator p15 (PC4) C-terminal domain-containing protein n=1 Tax=Scopulibacillus darangshiensis TaxID=442528 RepID=A0A4R2P581_9BACL|nr:PC4/YdbC family ssDNA-binding protein [Scopulibacillus darangshiensis]TCP29837.1 hypothetical protein EV207_108131 [Scopulibacillus darangshiensis]
MATATVSFEIIEHYGVMNEESNGWTRELNQVSWNEREPKYDIRSWSPNKERMGRGITLTKEEVASLKVFLNQLSL